MSLVQELRTRHGGLWDSVVSHPFVNEMGDGTLPRSEFRAYFLQDYLFVDDLVVMTALGVSKAPDLSAAGVLNDFLTGILNPENDMFARAFRDLGASEEEYASAAATPTTRAFSDFLVRVGFEGDFADIATVLYVTEGTYLDWGTRLLEAGKRPEFPVYREWIDLHGPDVLGGLVDWLGSYLDGVDDPVRLPGIEQVFVTALRYEYMFWEAAYHGERWPDPTT